MTVAIVVYKGLYLWFVEYLRWFLIGSSIERICIRKRVKHTLFLIFTLSAPLPCHFSHYPKVDSPKRLDQQKDITIFALQ